MVQSKGSAKIDKTKAKPPRGKKKIDCPWCKGTGDTERGGSCTTCDGHGILWIDK